MAQQPPYVFITSGDLANIDVDAIVVSTDTTWWPGDLHKAVASSIEGYAEEWSAAKAARNCRQVGDSEWLPVRRRKSTGTANPGEAVGRLRGVIVTVVLAGNGSAGYPGHVGDRQRV